jgi:hypothetical protein
MWYYHEGKMRVEEKLGFSLSNAVALGEGSRPVTHVDAERW